MGTLFNVRAAQTLPLVAAAVVGLALAAPASAQFARGRSGQYGNQDWQRRAYDNGYERGWEQSQRDVRDRRGYQLENQDYRRGDRGYDRRYSRYPNYPGRYPDQYPNRYPDRYPDSGGRYGSSSVGYSTGFSDGYEKGLEDADDRDRFDPQRHSRYRSADHGYNSRYGSKEAYKNAYRDGFRIGYERGYQESQYGRNGQRSNSGSWWPF